jgi:hypothetical protein
MRRIVVKRAATSATMDEITFIGHPSSVVTIGGGVVARQGHHDLDVTTRMTG